MFIKIKDSLCKPQMCSNSTMNSIYVSNFCNTTIYNRCCLSSFNATNIITGIDYSNCSLYNFDLQTNLTDEQREKIQIL